MTGKGARDRRHADTRAIVTGGTQGLGLAIARRLIAEGAPAVAIAGRNEARGRKAERELSGQGAAVRFIRADVADPGDCRNLVRQSIAAFGEVNALVNSAATTTRGTLVDTDPALWDEHMNTNLRGPFLLMQDFVAHRLARKKPGAIVNILSMSAHGGQPFLTAYSTSKGALATLTKNVAHAYRANRIRAIGINAGWMDTPGEDAIQKRFHDAPDDWLEKAEASQPMGQLVKPDHVAALAAYLLSPEAGVMTGAIVDFDQNVAGASG
jgi:NAD(P)-dependent dehydrogenase (short-subunit alcohol dehydrogenase family)